MVRSRWILAALSILVSCGCASAVEPTSADTPPGPAWSISIAALASQNVLWVGLSNNSTSEQLVCIRSQAITFAGLTGSTTTGQGSSPHSCQTEEAFVLMPANGTRFETVGLGDVLEGHTTRLRLELDVLVRDVNAGIGQVRREQLSWEGTRQDGEDHLRHLQQAGR